MNFHRTGQLHWLWPAVGTPRLRYASTSAPDFHWDGEMIFGSSTPGASPPSACLPY
jgi:hypothetical protein